MKPTRLYLIATGALGALTLLLLMAPTGGFPVRPIFQEVTVRTATNSRTNYSDTSQGSNEKIWACGVVGLQFACYTRNDSGAFGENWLEVERTGTNVDVIRLAGDSVSITGLPRTTVTETAINGSGMAVGDTIFISKAADSAITTSACVTDPDLQITNLPAGHYTYDAYLNATGGADGVRVCTTDAGITALATAVCGGGGGSTAPITNTGGQLCAGANLFRVHIRGESSKTWAGGTMGIAWRENTLGGADANAESDSWLKVVRVD